MSSSFSVNTKCAFNCNQIENQIKYIIIGDAKNDYEFKSRNLPIKNVLRILKHDGILSARLRLSKSIKWDLTSWGYIYMCSYTDGVI